MAPATLSSSSGLHVTAVSRPFDLYHERASPAVAPPSLLLCCRVEQAGVIKKKKTTPNRSLDAATPAGLSHLDVVFTWREEQKPALVAPTT